MTSVTVIPAVTIIRAVIIVPQFYRPVGVSTHRNLFISAISMRENWKAGREGIGNVIDKRNRCVIVYKIPDIGIENLKTEKSRCHKRKNHPQNAWKRHRKPENREISMPFCEMAFPKCMEKASKT